MAEVNVGCGGNLSVHGREALGRYDTWIWNETFSAQTITKSNYLLTQMKFPNSARLSWPLAKIRAGKLVPFLVFRKYFPKAWTQGTYFRA